jgi:hypothetical protein
MKPRTPRFEFDTALCDDVSRPFTLSRGVYVIEYTIQPGQASAYQTVKFSFALEHLRSAHECHKFDLAFRELQPGRYLVGRQHLRVPGGQYFLTLRLITLTHAWIRICRV